MKFVGLQSEFADGESDIRKDIEDALRINRFIMVPKWNCHVFAQRTFRAPGRDGLAAHLNDNGVPTAVHCPIPLHLQEAFRDLGYGTLEIPGLRCSSSGSGHP